MIMVVVTAEMQAGSSRISHDERMVNVQMSRIGYNDGIEVALI